MPSNADITWDTILKRGHRGVRGMRLLFRAIPSSPRCKMCLSPFAGPGGKAFRAMGFVASRKNPDLCARCLEHLPAGGAEVDTAVLFVDIRGSTELGGQLDPTAFAGVMNRFYSAATEVLVKRDAIIDKLIGDEVMAFFVPGIAGAHYREKAAEAATSLLDAVGYGAGEPWLRLGIGLHAGLAYVGNVGGTGVQDLTALGDTVNIAARLTKEASSGEVVMSESLWQSLETPAAADPIALQLKGKPEPFAARVLRPGQRTL